MRQEHYPPPTYTYLIVAEEVGRVKIGSSKDPWDRLRELQIGSPVRLTLLEVTTDVPERTFHTDPLLQQHRLHGEWYSITEGFARAFAGIVDRTASDCNFMDVDFFDLVYARQYGNSN